MTDADDTRRKRLLFQSWHRGMKEMDLVLGNFAERHLADFSPAQLDTFERLLAEEDADLWNWLSGRSPVPEDVFSDVWTLVQEFRFTV
jgi:antitoxin CptB